MSRFPPSFILLLAAALALSSDVAAQLNIPQKGDTARATLVKRTALRINNEPRYILINGVPFQDTDGPVINKSSSSNSALLYAKAIATQDSMLLKVQDTKIEEINATVMKSLLLSNTSRNVSEYQRAYGSLEQARLAELPLAIDNSDESFGARRLDVVGHNLQLFTSGVHFQTLSSLADELLLEVCGVVNISVAMANNHVFVADFDSIGSYSDPANRELKYVPSVIGFFCFNNATRQLLPLAIEIKSTKLVYTKRDTTEDWTLAKMALDAAELNHQHLVSYIDAHKRLVPIQVEMIQAMAPQHPVYALLEYHFGVNFAIEYHAPSTMFSEASSFNQVFGVGTWGALTFMMTSEQYTRIDEADFEVDMKRKGLEKHLPDHILVQHGTPYYKAIRDFVEAYLKTFYVSEAEVQSDTELQTWANKASQLNFVRGFPGKFTGFEGLTKLLAHLVFQSSVKHHMRHGPLTWHSIAAPFTTPALWNKPLPVAKASGMNPLEFAMPIELLPALSTFAASAANPVSAQFSMLHAYDAAPFANETKLAVPIARFRKAMQKLEEIKDEGVHATKLFCGFMRPSKVPVFAFA